MLMAANYLFFIFHNVLIAFNLFGWIWRPTRPWNLLTLALTGLLVRAWPLVRLGLLRLHRLALSGSP